MLANEAPRSARETHVVRTCVRRLGAPVWLGLLLSLGSAGCSSWQQADLSATRPPQGRVRVRTADTGWVEIRGATIQDDSVLAAQATPSGKEIRIPLRDVVSVESRRHNVAGTVTLILAAPVVFVIVLFLTADDTYTLAPPS